MVTFGASWLQLSSGLINIMLLSKSDINQVRKERENKAANGERMGGWFGFIAKRWLNRKKRRGKSKKHLWGRRRFVRVV